MSLSSEEEEDQFLPDGQLSLEDEDLDNLSSSSHPSDDDEDDEDDDEPFTNASRTHSFQSSGAAATAATAAAAAAPSHMLTFGPPYYGRPPTPLPPSPSLTSLLRPSRPTTPDASDDEHGALGGGGGPNSNNSNNNNGGGGRGIGGLGGAHAPVPRASPKVPTYEYYGFVLYLFSSCCFLIYLLWSYLPSPFLHALGIHYYPDRWWSLAVPSFLVALLAYVYVALALYNTEYLTLPLASLETVVDDAGKIAVVDGRGRLVVSEARRRNLERERVRERERERLERDRRLGTGGVGGAGGGSGGGGGGGGGRDKQHHQRKQSGGSAFGGAREVDWRSCWNEGTDAVMDVPLAGVCEVLYGGARPEEEEELGYT